MSEFTDRKITVQTAEMEKIVVSHETYNSSLGEQKPIDIYTSPDYLEEAKPAVLFVTGYSDTGFEKIFGCKQKDMGSYTSWARLLASNGIACITYENAEPEKDVSAVLDHLITNSKSIGIDATRIAIWACSGNVPNAINLAKERGTLLASAIFCYGYTVDLGADTYVQDAADEFKFMSPIRNISREDKILGLPFLVVRAGQDRMPNLNKSMDLFIEYSLHQNLGMEVINYPGGVHAFDLEDDTKAGQRVIHQVVDYTKSHLEIA